MICQNCGHETPDGMSFCMNCGNKLIVPEEPKPLEAWDYCPSCGEKVPANSAFCGNCGAKITNPIPTIGTDLKSMPAPETVEPESEPIAPITLTNEPEIPKTAEPIELAAEPAPIPQPTQPIQLDTEPAVTTPVREQIVLETPQEEIQPAPQPAQPVVQAVETPAPQPASAARVCPTCGDPIEEGEIFCSTCGTKLEVPAPAVVQPEPVTPTPMQPTFCTTCGTQLAPGTAFCSVCGTRVGSASVPEQLRNTNYTAPVIAPVPSTNNPQTTYAQPAYNPNIANPAPAVNEQRGMKWFKFLIYFAIFAGAVANLVTGIMYLTGLTYSMQGSSAAQIYFYFPGLSLFDKIYGILLLALAGYGIFTRFQLSKFKKRGPMFYLILLAASTVLSLIYAVGVFFILNAGGASLGAADILQDLGSPFGTIIMIALNYIYFNKRKDLFVN